MLAAEFYDVEYQQIDCRAIMDWEGDNIMVEFHPLPPTSIDITSN